MVGSSPFPCPLWQDRLNRKGYNLTYMHNVARPYFVLHVFLASGFSGNGFCDVYFIIKRPVVDAFFGRAVDVIVS